MKHLSKRIIAALVAFLLIILVISFANSLVGNPISRYFATKDIKHYITVTYPHTDYKIDHTGYDFKFGQYYADIISPSSKDTSFIISWEHGEIVDDTFAINVKGHQNTIMRYEDEAAAQIALLLDVLPELKKEDIKVSFDKDFLESPRGNSFAFDSPYDKAMHLPINLSISYNTDTPTLESYSRILEQVHKIAYANGHIISYYSIANYNAKNPSTRINVCDVSSKQIESGSLLSILKAVSNTDPSFVPDQSIDPSLYSGKLSVTSFDVE